LRCLPAQALCLGKESPESYPAAKGKKTTPVRHKTIVVLKNDRGEYFATPRASRFLNGLFHFVETDDASDTDTAQTVKLGHIRQQYSHFTLEADVYLRLEQGQGEHWHGAAALAALPCPWPSRKY